MQKKRSFTLIISADAEVGTFEYVSCLSCTNRTIALLVAQGTAECNLAMKLKRVKQGDRILATHIFRTLIAGEELIATQ
jgi:ribosomal protein S27E